MAHSTHKLDGGGRGLAAVLRYPGSRVWSALRPVMLALWLACGVGCAALGGGRVRPSHYAGTPFRAQIGFQNVKIGVVWVGYEDAAVVIVDNKDKVLFKQAVPRPVSHGSYELTLDPKTESLVYVAKSYPGMARSDAETVPMAGKVQDTRQVIPIPQSLIHPELTKP